LSAEIGKLLAAGQLVSDEIINAIVEKRLAEADCVNGFVLEGYPRSMKQVEFLKANTDLDYVFLIDVPDEIIIERVVGRRSCPQGHPWHVKYLPPKVEGICDICGGVLTQRSDDTEETAKTRLNVYHQEVDGVIEYYKNQGVLITVKGDQHVEEVYRDLVKPLVSDLIK
jgi:adenylate kinase